MKEAGLGTHENDLRLVELIKDSSLKVSLDQGFSLTREEANVLLKPLYLLVNLQPLVALFIKISFFIYFYQIFGPKTVLRWSIWIGAIVTTVFYSAVTITLFVLTSPDHAFNLGERFKSFLDNNTSPIVNTTIALGYFNVFSDLYILILSISD